MPGPFLCKKIRRSLDRLRHELTLQNTATWQVDVTADRVFALLDVW